MKIFGMMTFKQMIRFDTDGPGSGAPPAGSPPAANPPQNETPKNDPPKQDDSWKKELEKLRNENEKLKRSFEERDRKEAEKNGEFEKLYNEMKAKNDDLARQYKQDKIKAHVTLQAKDMGLKSNVYIKLFDLESLELDPQGNVIDLQDKLEYFKKEHPDLFTNGGSNTKGEGSDSDNNKVPSTDQNRRSHNRSAELDDVDAISKKIHDPKTSTRERNKLIARRLTLLQKKRQ